MRLIVLDNCVNFHDPSLNRSREIRSEAVVGGIQDSLFHYNFWPEADHDILHMAVGYVGADVRVKFGDSMLTGSQDIWGPVVFMSNERTNMTDAYHIRRKRLIGTGASLYVTDRHDR